MQHIMQAAMLETLNEETALAKAQELWGSEGAVNNASAHGRDCFQVGLKHKKGIWVIGLGISWEEAFENALSHPKDLPVSLVKEG
jgi:hypothetical protein